MTDTTLNNALFGADSANPALRAVANVQKSAQPAAGKTQDFGAVLDKTVQKLENPGQTADNGAKSKVQQSEKTTVETKQDKIVEDTDAAVDEKISDTTAETKESVEEQEQSETKESVDEMTIDEITRALEQIIAQIKEILGITDEELLTGMEELGLESYDLLNADNMAQLVTAISGEDSVISLVADEKLYTALQDITEMVNAQENGLLDKTGLTEEELDTVLQKLREMEDQNPEEAVQESEILSAETTGEVTAEQVEKEPVIIREDNTKSDDQPAKQYDTLPENQQENPVEVGAKPQTQNTGKDAKDSEDKDSKSF